MTWPATIATATSGGTALSSDFNNHANALKAIGDTAVSYTPTWGATTTTPSLGNGVLSGAYVLAGKHVLEWAIVLVIGSSTSTGAGAFTFTAPFPPSSRYPLHSPIGRATLFDTSANTVYCRTAVILTAAGSGSITLRDESSTTISGTVPVTVATGDRIVVIGNPYETS